MGRCDKMVLVLALLLVMGFAWTTEARELKEKPAAGKMYQPQTIPGLMPTMPVGGLGGFPSIGAGGLPGFGGMPGIGSMQGIGGLPGFGGMPGIGGMPGMPGLGGMPGMPGLGGMPGLPGVGNAETQKDRSP